VADKHENPIGLADGGILAWKDGDSASLDWIPHYSTTHHGRTLHMAGQDHSTLGVNCSGSPKLA